VRNECGVKESIIDKYENGKMVWSCGEDERIAKQVLNGCVEGVRGRARPKDSWMVVVDKCLKNKNVRSTKCKRNCQRNIMSVEEASGVKIELNGGRFVVGGKMKGGNILCCWLTPNGIIAS
jgi:hypothetical protein